MWADTAKAAGDVALALGLAMAAARLCRGTPVVSVLGTCVLRGPPSWEGGWHSFEGAVGMPVASLRLQTEKPAPPLRS